MNETADKNNKNSSAQSSEPNIILLRDKTLEELERDYGRQWDTPVLFDDIETPDIPASLLPGVIGEYAKALAVATETPEALSVMTILGVLSVAVAQKFKVSPKEGWHESINIYALIALPPANNKTLVLKNCTQPLTRWEHEQKILHEKDILRQRSERKSQEQWVESLRKRLAKINDDAKRQELIRDIAEKEAHLIIPAVLPILFANDITPESLVEQTCAQGGRFAIFSDEGGILETLAGLYSHGHANIDILLKGIDGGDIRTYRKGREYHLNAFLTMVMAVQPGVIQKMAAKPAFTGNGLLERFLYVIPKSKLGYRTHDKPPVPFDLQERYTKKVTELLNIPVSSESSTRLLALSTSAQKIWRDFQAAIEIMLRPDQELASCQSWGGKLAGFSLRLAGLLHVAEQAEQPLVISESIMQAATTLSRLLIKHAIAAYNLMGIDQSKEDAKAIFQWIQTQGKAHFTRSDLVFAMRNRQLGNRERIAKALSTLMEQNLIQAELISTRKPTTLFHVHPALCKNFQSDVCR